MTTNEFSREFDIRFNYVSSNLAYSVNDYEKSVYLTRAQEEILDNYFNPKGNKYQEGFDMSLKRNIDFSPVIKTSSLSAEKTGIAAYDKKGLLFEISDDVFKVLNDRFDYIDTNNKSIETSVMPIDYDSYQRVKTKPYQNPPTRQSWKMVRSGDATGKLVVEIIPKKNIDKAKAFTYTVRYLLRPTPIVVAALPNGFTVNGVSAKTECILPPEIHDEILNRAIELCRVDYLGDASSQVQLNQRNE